MPSALKTRILRGVGASALGQVANAGIQLVSLPVFLAVWGVEQYGEWLVLSSLAAFLSMSDIGFGTAAANEMTMRVGRGERAGAVEVYHSMWALLTGLGLAVLAVLLAVLWGTPASAWVPVKTIAPGETAAVLSILAIYILLGLQLGVAAAGFRCDGNFALGQLLGTGGRVAEFAAQVAAAATTRSMLAVAMAGLAVRCAALVVNLAVLRWKSPWLPLGVSGANGRTVRELFVPAVSFLGLPLGNALSNQGMIQVVAAVLGPAAVVVFTAHRTIANVAIQLMTTINHAVWPELSTAYGAGNLPLTRRLHRSACQVTIWLSLAACIALASAAPVIIPIWTHGRIAYKPLLFAVMLSVIVLRTAWLTSLFVPMAINRHAGVSLAYLVASGGGCGLAFVLAGTWGLVGAALGMVAAELFMVGLVTRTALAMIDDSLTDFVRTIAPPPIGMLLSALPKRRREVA